MEFTQIQIAMALGTATFGAIGFIKQRRKLGADHPDAQFDPMWFFETLVIPVVACLYLQDWITGLLGLAALTPQLAFAIGMSGKVTDEIAAALLQGKSADASVVPG